MQLTLGQAHRAAEDEHVARREAERAEQWKKAASVISAKCNFEEVQRITNSLAAVGGSPTQQTRWTPQGHFSQYFYWNITCPPPPSNGVTAPKS
jgi:hypothetical protein